MLTGTHEIQTKQIPQVGEDSQKDVEGWRSSGHIVLEIAVEVIHTVLELYLFQ